MRIRILLLAAAGLSAPALPAAGAESAPSKKEQLLRDKASAPPVSAAERARRRKGLRRLVGQKAGPVVNIYNTWTHETVAVDPKGREAPVADLVNRLFRCHFTNHQIGMDAKLVGILVKAAQQFRAPRVEIVSGFRAPKYNLMLRKKGRRVARQSEHTFGHAVDFRLPGVATDKLRRWARRQRMGGVGFYRDDAFVHVDTGAVRYWAE